MSAESLALSLPVPPEWLEQIAERVAEIVLERHAADRGPAYLTADEAAGVMRCGRKRIYELVSRRELECVRDGTRLLIPREAIDTYLNGKGEGRPKGARR
jgi:excisionase family DNA binding protein